MSSRHRFRLEGCQFLETRLDTSRLDKKNIINRKVGRLMIKAPRGAVRESSPWSRGVSLYAE